MAFELVLPGLMWGGVGIMYAIDKQIEDRVQEEVARRKAAEEARLSDEGYPCPDYLQNHYRDSRNGGVFLIGVVGSSGAGKSSLINTIIGRDVAASSAVGESTLEPTAYVLPHSSGLVVIFDLPGANTARFPQETYIRTTGLRYFDAVVHVYNTRWLQVDDQIVQELDNHNVPVFVVRTNMDSTLANMRRRDNGATLQQAIASCQQALQGKSFVANHRLFQVSNHWAADLPANAPENSELARLACALFDHITAARNVGAEFVQGAKNSFEQGRSNGVDVTTVRGALATMVGALFGGEDS